MGNLPDRIDHGTPGLVPEHLEVMFRQLEGCCLHSPLWTPVGAERVLCSVWHSYGEGWQDSAAPDGDYSGWKNGTDSESYTVVRLKDGRYGLLSESEDYTGHGCQCSSATNVYGSVGELLQFGVDDEGARQAIRMRLAVPGMVVGDAGEIEAAPGGPKAVTA